MPVQTPQTFSAFDIDTVKHDRACLDPIHGTAEKAQERVYHCIEVLLAGLLDAVIEDEENDRE